MPYQKADLILGVLVELHKAEAGQAIDDSDRATVDGRLDAIVAELARKNVSNIDLNSIDADSFNDLVRYVAEIMAPAFGRPTDLAAKAQAEGELKRASRINGGANLLLSVDRAARPGRRYGGFYRW